MACYFKTPQPPNSALLAENTNNLLQRGGWIFATLFSAFGSFVTFISPFIVYFTFCVCFKHIRGKHSTVFFRR